MQKQQASFMQKISGMRYAKIAVFVVVFAAIAGTLLYRSHAATTTATITGKSSRVPVLYVLPESQKFSTSKNVVFSIWENSQTTSVNAVQANLTYNPSVFDFVGIDNSSSPFNIHAQSIGSNGVVKIASGINGKLTGTQLIASVTLRPKVSSGTTVVNFSTDSILVDAVNNTNVLQSKVGGNYTLAP